MGHDCSYNVRLNTSLDESDHPNRVCSERLACPSRRSGPIFAYPVPFRVRVQQRRNPLGGRVVSRARSENVSENGRLRRVCAFGVMVTLIGSESGYHSRISPDHALHMVHVLPPSAPFSPPCALLFVASSYPPVPLHPQDLDLFGY